MSLSTVKKFQLPTILDARGSLSVFENNRYFPFEIQWVSWFWNHAEIRYDADPQYNDFEQVIVLLSGSLLLSVSDGIEEVELVLDHSSNCIYIPPMILVQLKYASKDSTAFIASNVPAATEKPSLHFFRNRKASHEQFPLHS